jgi:hypothetical protein
MDLRKTIADLYEEKTRLDRVIASLEQLAAEPPLVPFRVPHRGRKFMSPQERRKVSERMRRYWAGRKAAENSAVQVSVGSASAASAA